METIFYPNETHHFNDLVATIGNFDGVHLGHKSLITNLQKHATSISKKSAIITFQPHPKKYFNRDSFFELTSFKKKQDRLSKLGVDYLIVLDFSEVMNLSGTEFINQILIEYLNISELWVGEDFRFGKGRSAGFEELIELQNKFVVRKVEKTRYQNQEISSSLIRDLILKGDQNEADKLLGI